MRVRKIAKQLKKFHASVTYDNEGLPVCGYKISRHGAKVSYIMRMTRKYYYGNAKKSCGLASALYIHKACSPYLYDEILAFWGWRE
jgi:hypothetical protein